MSTLTAPVEVEVREPEVYDDMGNTVRVDVQDGELAFEKTPAAEPAAA